MSCHARRVLLAGVLLVGTAMVHATTIPPGHSTYRVLAIGDGFFPWALNDAGEVVGAYGASPLPFRWSADQGHTFLMEAAGSAAFDVNNLGDVLLLAPDGALSVWHSDGDVTAIPSPEMQFAMLNDLGQIVGMTVDDTPFVWPQPPVDQDIPGQASVVDLNDAGQVLLSISEEVFVWEAGAVPLLRSVPCPVAMSCTPLALNLAGDVVVFGLDEQLQPRKYLVTSSGTIEIEPPTSAASDLNDSQQLVGGDRIWNPLGGLVDFPTLLPDGAPFIYDARDINERGAIAATGHIDLVFGGFLLIPESLELLDPNHPGVFQDGALVPDLEILASDVLPPRVGLTADGTTPLLLRTPTFDAQVDIAVRIRDEFLSHDIDDVGILSNPLTGEVAQEDGTPLIIETVELVPGTGVYQGFALLTAPGDFARPATADTFRGYREPRELTLISSLVGSPQSERSQIVRLYPPPVVLVHGLEDFPDSWNWQMAEDYDSGQGRFIVERADYKASHANRLTTNVVHVREAIERAVETYRALGVAATQADVFGHSMGGLLSRLYALDKFIYSGLSCWTKFLRDDNFMRGDIHKLVTVNTPHYGSPLSDLTVTPDNTLTLPGVLTFPYSIWEERCPTGGAVADLRTDSPILQLMNSSLLPVNLPVHAIYGADAENGPFFTHPYPVRTYFAAFSCGLSGLTELFDGPNDAIVSEISQRAGLDSGHSTSTPGNAGLHFPTINECPCPSNDIAESLLDASVSDTTVFRNGFPVFTGTPPGAPVCGPELVFLPNGLELSTNCTTVAPGVSFDVTVQGKNGFTPLFVLAYTSEGDARGEELPPYEFTFTAPSDFVGVLRLQAVGLEPSGGWAASDIEECEVATPSTLEHLEVRPHPVRLFSYAPEIRVRVYGHFDDGSVVDLTASDLGTTYLMQDATIAEIDAEGRVVALKVGQTTLTVTHGSVQGQTTVFVVSVRGDWNSDGVVDAQDAEAFEACLTGSWMLPEFELPSVQCSDTFDFDEDTDIDLDDLDGLIGVWSGPVGEVEVLSGVTREPGSDELAIEYSPACGATDHRVYSGALENVSDLAFDGAICSIGTSGLTSFDPGPGDRFFVIVGDDGSAEGSYGTNSLGVERPERTSAVGCELPQELTDTCDGLALPGGG